MVVAPADIPIDRTDVAKWVKRWKKMDPDTRPTIQAYIRTRVDKLKLDDPMVTRSVGDEIHQIHIADLIADDLESYGVDPSS